MRAIVLSGGGAKGAYEIGVWKALKKLNISYEIITGTSVGALNGAFMVQNDYSKALKMWQNIDFDLIFKDGFQGDIHTFEGVKKLISMYGKGIIKGGMDVSRLEETIHHYINPTKFYQSNIQFGLVTVNLSTLKPITLSKDQIPREKLKDYLMASATCFPAFKTKKISEEYYIDGGYYDNLPIDLAIQLGATEVIAVDIGGKKLFPQKSKHFAIPITYIKPKNDLGSFLVFDKLLAIHNMKLGFLDTMKVYRQYEGNKLTFEKGELQKLILFARPKIKKAMSRMLNHKNYDKIVIRDLKQLKKYEMLLSDEQQLDQKIKDAIETLGLFLFIPITKVYKKNSYLKAIRTSFSKIKNLDLKMIETAIEKRDFSNFLDKQALIKYNYELFKRMDEQGLLSMLLLSEKDFFASLYLSILIN